MAKDVGAYANYAVNGIAQVIDNFGPREPGSAAERAAQKHVATEMAHYTDEVVTEEFVVHPKAFMSFMPIAAVLLLAAVVVYWLGYAAVSLVFSALALTIAFLQFFRYRRFLDPLFPAAKSLNVTGTYKPKKKAKRRVIISGHIDAAYEWRFNYKGGQALLTLVIGGLLINALLKLGMDIYAVAAGGATGSPTGLFAVLGYIQLIGVPFYIASLFFSDFNRVVPGANDNLSAVFGAMAVVKYLHDQGIRFEHTEVCCLSTGSEEAGLRGAKAYAEMHPELRDGEIETIFIVFETLRELEYMNVYNRDMSGTVKNNPQVSALLQRAGKICDMELPLASIYLGASDAAAFTQAGMKASTLAAMDPAPARYYHTRLDDKDNLSAECLEKAIEITLEAIEIFDRDGLQTG